MLWACVIHGAQFMLSRQKQRSPQLVAQEQSQSTALIPIIGFFTIYFKHCANKISTKKTIMTYTSNINLTTKAKLKNVTYMY